MSHAFAAPQSQGHFHYLDCCIYLPRLDHRHAVALEANLGLDATGIPDTVQREQRALVMHEVTHLLDMTTTNWGLEFTYRKLRLAQHHLGLTSASENPLEVLMLNFSEVAMHRLLFKPDPTLHLGVCERMTHGLIEDARLGIVVQFQFWQLGKVVLQVPLSILSVLEANAYANEILLSLSDIDRMPDPHEKRITKAIYEKETLEALNNPELCEYTLLVRLVRLHFPDLEFEQQLNLVAALARFTLNLGVADLSMVANRLAFSNNYLGGALKMDLRRGASRAIVFLKTIFGLYAALHDESGADLSQQLRISPHAAIHELWSRQTDGMLGALDEFAPMLHKLPHDTGLHDLEVFTNTAIVNRQMLATQPPGRLAFSALQLPDILLGDNTAVRMPNRLALDMFASLEANLPVLCWLQSQCNEAAAIRKFYMSPQVAASLGR
jgi:hypothetical protein